MAPKSKVRGPADHEEELADLQRRFDALGKLPLPTPAPHGPHTLGRRPALMLGRRVPAQRLQSGRPTSTRRC